jgi:hypothetical protein
LSPSGECASEESAFETKPRVAAISANTSAIAGEFAAVTAGMRGMEDL